jgi:hypothetical protein
MSAPLRAPFEPSSIGGESRKIHVLTNNYQKINIGATLAVPARLHYANAVLIPNP